ncbi:hypothetical protein ACFFOM_03185 [Microlunatus capsulatus]|uniref:Lipoprotein n=1 Tax=Microlunatus capsulatus TaxID=99117 RepID=A0ABS4Z2J0_9ACTN|nr:hypothetical protein [Microlunatus capsulatus]MBP2415269.1 hypothetical protein [Microlunatus capsulatus]
MRTRTATVTAALAAGLLLLGGCGADGGAGPTPEPSASTAGSTPSPASTALPSPTPSGTPSPSATPSPTPAALELPRGGRTVFPRYRLVGYAGLTGAPTLGRLGTGPLDQRVDELERRARPYRDGREVLPVLEVIATIVQADPGRDGTYRTRIGDDQIARYLRAARAHDALLLLNIQPGRADFLDEAKAYRRWLDEPDVGLALDPEWAMGPGQVPGRVFGHTTGRELDGVARYLSDVVAAGDLPEKVLVYHQLAPSVVRREQGLRDHRGVAVVKSVDGIGSRGAKEATYRLVDRTTPEHVHAGFKLFYDEDAEAGPLMTPAQVLALRPRPEYVLYE